MKRYAADATRTMAVVGHAKSGVTSLCEALLYDAGSIDRMGSVDNETSHLDVDPEEVRHHATLQCHMGFCEWKKHKINFIDTPGDHSFIGDQSFALSAVDSGVVVISASDGVQVVTEQSWKNLDENDLPRIIFVNKLDREHASFDDCVKQVQEHLCENAVPLQIPFGEGTEFKGVIDLLRCKVYTIMDKSRNVIESEIPEDMSEEVGAARDKMMETIASIDESLIAEYFESGELAPSHFERAIHDAVGARQIVPIVCGSAAQNIGIQLLLDLLVEACPSPTERSEIVGKDPDGNEIKRKPVSTEPFTAQVFKTMGSDIGRIYLARVFSGVLRADSAVYNPTTETKERVGQIYELIGKERVSINEAGPGEIVALTKLKGTHTGNTLCDEAAPILLPVPRMPEPTVRFTIHAQNKADEEKAIAKVAELVEEDPSLRFQRDPETHEMILSGLGQSHIEVAAEKLERFGLAVALQEPRIPYRETIRGSATHVEGRHKKQSGGRGQFGVCFIDLEPSPRGEDAQKSDPLIFENAIVGGAIPKQFIPSVEKGIRDRMSKGILAGFPIVDIKVTLRDGKYHPVDSDGRSFEMAGSKALREAFATANACLLEPIMELEIRCLEADMGSVLGDLSSRRGQVFATEQKGGMQVIRAHAPLSEVSKYAIDLESMTAGRGQFHMHFSRYEEVPAGSASDIISAAKK